MLLAIRFRSERVASAGRGAGASIPRAENGITDRARATRPTRSTRRVSTLAGLSGKMRHRSDSMDADPGKKPFTPEVLDKTDIAIPLLDQLKETEAGPNPRTPLPVIIDANLEYRDGARAARQRIEQEIRTAIARGGSPNVSQGISTAKSQLSEQYVFATLEPRVIRELVRLDVAAAETPGQTPA